MPTNPTSLHVRLFYSYSHKDLRHKQDMEAILANLRRDDLLREWSDAQITPGQSITAAIQTKLSEADIIVFLLSPDFLNSKACREEWDTAKQSDSHGRLVFRVPIIVRECPWQDFLADDDLKALPPDGKPITAHQDADSAWNEVYEGIKSVIDTLRTTYTPKLTFLTDFDSADIPSTQRLTLNDIFVFPRLTTQDYGTKGADCLEAQISSADDLLDQGNSVTHGQDKSGKTALAKHIFLNLVSDRKPVLFADLGAVSGRPAESHLRTLYEEQFNGDYDLWLHQDEKTLILDNMTEHPPLLKFIEDCTSHFSKVLLFASSDVFHAFLFDEQKLAEFKRVTIAPLTRIQQEALIRKRLATLERHEALTDEFVDQAEDRVNSIIVENKIVPRYPFFVLSILQTYDVFMPSSITITSYGHCYYIFIIASLQRAGILEADDSLNSALNFLERLALATFRIDRERDMGQLDFDNFQNAYRSEYYMEIALLNRLTHDRFGILTKEGRFKSGYMYYYFLGKRLATKSDLAKRYIPELCDSSFGEASYLTLLFAIHHATDAEIIDEILIRTMVALEYVPIATLNDVETARFSTIVSELPESVLSNKSVEDERARARRHEDSWDDEVGAPPEKPARQEDDELGSSLLRIFRNNKILGQVLRNQYGKLQKDKVEEIVETIADSCFRVVNVLLKDEDEIRKFASVLHAQRPDADLREIQQLLRYLSFVWTMTHIELAVHAVNVPGIREAIDIVVKRHNTPAYQIFGYFSDLDNADSLNTEIHRRLSRLVKGKNRATFIRRVLSLRTQSYMNTHHSRMNIEQAICSVLKIEYNVQRRVLAAAKAERQ